MSVHVCSVCVRCDMHVETILWPLFSLFTFSWSLGNHTQVVGFEWQELWLLPIPLTLNIHAQQKVEFSILKVRW